MLLKLAWRNIWRNQRRTLITVASILFAVALASFMESIQKGAWNNMISNVVNYYFGYAQIHQQGYWEEQTINKAFDLNDTLRQLEDEIPGVEAVLPRLESFALASAGNQTKGVMVVGIDPEAENSMTNLKDRVSQGRYLEREEEAVLLAEGVAQNLQLEVGDTLILISQGYRGVNAAGKFPIEGIVHFSSPDLNKQMVYLPLPAAQWFYGADGLVTSLALKITDQDEIRPAVRAIKARLPAEAYEVMDWQELLPDLVQAKELDSAGNYIVYFILYLIIAFGIFGTVLMMTKEREYEFGILIAIGMRRLRLAAVIWLEVFMLGIIGALAGIIAAIPVVRYFHLNPLQLSGAYAESMEKFGFDAVFPAEFKLEHFLLQALVVLLITTVVAFYPVLKIRKLEPVEAMRD